MLPCLAINGPWHTGQEQLQAKPFSTSRIETAVIPLKKEAKGDEPSSTPIAVFEQQVLTWKEREQKAVLVLRALCRLTEENPDETKQGFTSLDIVEKVGEIDGRPWNFSEKASKKISGHWKEWQTIYEKKKTGIIQHLDDNGLTEFPSMEIVNKGGGSGNETRYAINWCSFDEDPEIDQILNSAPVNSGPLPKGWIRYVCEDVEGISRYLTKGWRVQLIVAIALLALIFRACKSFCVNCTSEFLRHSVRKLDHKAVHRGFPVADGHGPFSGCCLDGQIDHLYGRLIVREHLAVFDGLTDHAVQ